MTCHRDILLSCFHQALEAVNGERVVQRQLEIDKPAGPVHVVAIGKAAAAMARGAWTGLGGRLARALVITRHGHGDEALARDGRFSCLEADHPLPGEASLAAGTRLLEFIAATPNDASLLFLISGGTSSLVEVLPEGMTLANLQRLNGWLLGSGLDIQAMNRVRSAVSRIKAGRLRGYLGQRSAQVWLISDVPGNDPAVIGSGLLTPTRESLPLPTLPAGLSETVHRAMAAHATLSRSTPSVPARVLATLEDACRAAGDAARQRHCPVTIHGEFLKGEAAERGAALAHWLTHEGRATPGVHVWGGETTVTLPENSGQGGRNQHLALAAARVLSGCPDVTLLAAGTDGSDGVTSATGALVDGGTWERIRAQGLDPDQALSTANAHPCLQASGDLLETGPTGTNVMDLVIAHIS
ncbi:MAG: glycerate kinase type-2 family protein [Pseudomonadota bacterium]